MLLNGLEKVGTRLDRREAASQMELNTLYSFQGVVLLDAVQAFAQHVRKLAPKSDQEWEAAVIGGLRFAQIEINRHEPKELE